MASRESRAERIFLDAVEKCCPDEWPAFVQEACGDDRDLLGRVEALLKAHQESNPLLDDNRIEATSDLPPIAEGPGTQIGRYKLLEQIGEGGMGVVYMAEQSEPVERRVALKIVKLGMDTRQVITRFEAERQALALMDHPNIAKMLDAGTTDTGRPYFVMELVKGIPVTQYCDERTLTPQQRLELFVPICQAVEHAHHKGIIHRDLKPSNILIARYDGKPVPRVIDFGVAKAIGIRLTAKTLFTRYGQIVGTIEYMSPEQAELNQLDIDTRSDIYSLGVLLYELLTGEMPFDKRRLRSAAFDEMLRIIRDEEPPRPSAKLSGSQTLSAIATNRNTEPQKLRLLVQGELDWIVMTALEKDRQRRYQTASRLSEDILNYLNGDAVTACPPSMMYRFRKFSRRNKATIAAIASISLALIVGTTIAVSQAIRATKALRRTVVAEQRAREEVEIGRQRLYSSDVALARTALDDNNVDDVLELLDRHYPRNGARDHRHFEWFYLWNQCSRAIRTPKLHLALPGISGAFSPDGGRLAVGQWSQVLQVFDLEGKVIGRQTLSRAFRAEATEWVKAVAYSPDGRYLAAPQYGGIILLFDRDLKIQKTLEGHSDTVNALAFSPDNRTLCSGGDDTNLILWNMQSWEKRSLQAHKAPVYAVAYSPDGSLIASADVDGELILWKQQGTTHHTLTRWAHRSLYGGAVTFSPDGSMLACATNHFGTHQVMIIDLKAPVLDDTAIRVFGHHTDQIRALAFMPGQAPSVLVTGGRDNSIKLWDVTRERCIDELKGHSGFVQDLCLSPNGTTLASIGRDLRVRLWNLKAKRLRSVIYFESEIVDFFSSHDATHMFVLTRDGVVKLVDLYSGKRKHVDFGTPLNVKRMAGVADSRHVLLLQEDQGYIFNTETREGKAFRFSDILSKYSDEQPIALSRDASVFAIGARSGAMYFGHANNEIRHRSTESKAAIQYVAVDPDGHTVASADAEGTLRLWDVATGNCVQKCVPHDGLLYGAVAFSPDGRWLVSGGGDNRIKIFDRVSKFKPSRILQGHTGPPKDFLFADDGNTLISSGGDGQIIAWDLLTDKRRFTFTANAGAGEQLTWISDHAFASLSLSEIRIWEAATPEQVEADMRHLEVDPSSR